MRSFTTDNQFNVSTSEDSEAFLFEVLETYANGIRFQVQQKNESGRWGGRGTDVHFTFPFQTATKSHVANFYRDCVMPNLE